MSMPLVGNTGDKVDYFQLYKHNSFLMPISNFTQTDHTARDTALGAGAGGVLGHEGHHGHTARDTALGGFAGHEAGHHGDGTASGHSPNLLLFVLGLTVL